ncbi:MAG: hypothetical protein V8T31_02965 [Lachnospiraceae bacterium]
MKPKQRKRQRKKQRQYNRRRQKLVQTEAVQPETQEAVQTEAVLRTQAAVQTEVAVLETESVTHPTAATATLYIGYDGSFHKDPFETTEAITPEALVRELQI